VGTSNTVAGAVVVMNIGGGVAVGVETGGSVAVGVEAGGGTLSAIGVVMITKTRGFSGMWGRGHWGSWWLVVGTGDGGDERIVLLWVLGTVCGSASMSVRVYGGVKFVGNVGVVTVSSVSSVSSMSALSDTEATSASAESSSGGVVDAVGAMGTVSTMAIQVGVDSGIKLVGNVGVVWAGGGSVRTEAAYRCGAMASSVQNGNIAVV